ncbi:DUF4333 domain-containing protein [Stenomitos frigidus]|uniref:DUF4333 domain-containing protein n=1 Tax=Stenomitos frigidus ULC18 TaxID=2107698 RepID=A0A2T1DY27_9CYAN|nr:DUF4333 domain-containing protein [Stenomitos frigidus]PSB25341.1 hypothetical protein C7B82_23700 [Stenomitos frigidus ULC18]
MNRFVLLTLGVLLLSACGKTLDDDRVAQSIQQDVIKQGGVSLKTVTCPKNIKPEAGQSFECIGETDTGYTFTIPVKQQDAQGNVLWDVPNAKGLLNLAKFETIVQESVQGEIGSRPLIRCGGIYKAVKAGQTFECAIEVKQPTLKPKVIDPKSQAAKLKTVAVRPNKPDTIRVTIDPENNINWQRIIPGVVNPTTGKSPATKAAQAAAKVTQPTSATTKAAPPAKGNADDFLNQPGAADQF